MYLEKTQPLLDDLSVMIQGVNSLELWNQFEPMLNACENFIGEPNSVTSIPILFLGIPSIAEISLLESYFEQKLAPAFLTQEVPNFFIRKNYGETSLNLHFWNTITVDSTFLEERKTAILVFLFKSQQQSKGLLQAIRLMTERSGLLYLYTRFNLPKNERDLLSKPVGKFITEQIITLKEQHLSIDFTHLMGVENHKACQALMGIAEIDRINKLFLAAHQQQKLNLKIKKMQLTQKQMHIQQKAKKNQKNGGALENAVNLRLSQFEQRFNNAVEENLKPVLGNFSTMISQDLALLEDLEETKRAKQIAFTIPQRIADGLIKKYKNNCKDLILTQKQEAIKCMKTIHREISKFLGRYDLKPIQSSTEIIEDLEIQYLLNHKIVFEKKFEGAMSSRGIMEYIMGARMYFMYVMMGASMLGFSIRRNEDIKQYMASIAILLIGLGIYQVWSSKQDEKEEQSEKHLQSAQDFIKNQFKRISQDISKAMDKLIAEKVRKQAERSIINAEQLLQTKLETERKKLEIQKIKTDRMLKNVATQEKNLDSISRSQATFEKNLDRLKTTLQSNFKLKTVTVSTVINPAIIETELSERAQRKLERLERKQRRAKKLEG